MARQEPLLIGVGIEDGGVVRHFRGELKIAAIWLRALTYKGLRRSAGRESLIRHYGGIQ